MIAHTSIGLHTQTVIGRCIVEVVYVRTQLPIVTVSYKLVISQLNDPIQMQYQLCSDVGYDYIPTLGFSLPHKPPRFIYVY